MTNWYMNLWFATSALIILTVAVVSVRQLWAWRRPRDVPPPQRDSVAATTPHPFELTVSMYASTCRVCGRTRTDPVHAGPVAGQGS